MKFNSQELLKQFVQFRKSVWFRILYLLVLGVIVAELFQILVSGTAVACLGLLLIPAAVFVVPYYFGERSTKHFALNGIPVLLLALLLVTTFQTQAVLASNSVELTSGIPSSTTNLPALSLWNGTVSPFTATPPTDFNFSVRLKTVPSTLTNVTVYLNLTTIHGYQGTAKTYKMARAPWNASGPSNGTWWTVSERLDSGIYAFWFWANDKNGNFTYTLSPPQGPFGPIAAGFSDYYGFFLYITVFNLAIPFSFYYIIIFMFWYTARTRRMRARMIDVKAKAKAGKNEEVEEKPKPAPGGKATKVTAFTCTNCGADVEDTDEKCPKCGAVFED